MAGRALTGGERALARRIFGDAINLDRVQIGGWGGRFAFVTGSRILFPRGAPADFAAAPPRLQAWLVHELTHVWQFQTRPVRTLASWLGVLLSGGYGRGLKGYRYGLPLGLFGAYNLEQQARIVEHGFLLDCGADGPPEGACADDYRACTPFTAPAERATSDA